MSIGYYCFEAFLHPILDIGSYHMKQTWIYLHGSYFAPQEKKSSDMTCLAP